MFNNTVIKESLPEDVRADEIFQNVQLQIINTLSEKQFTISQTRHLFNSILEQFERYMPVTNHKQSL